MQAESRALELPGSANQLFNTIRDPLLLIDTVSGKIIAANSGARDLFDLEEGPVCIAFSTLFHAIDSRESVDTPTLPLNFDSIPQFFTFKRAHGGFCEVECSASPIEEGSRNLVLLRCSEIVRTEAREKNGELGRHSLLDTVLNTGSVFFVVISTDGKIVLVNRTMLETTGYKERDLNGKKYVDVFIPAETRESKGAEIQEMLTLNPRRVYTSEVLCADGRRLPVEWRSGLISSDDGKAQYLFGFGTEITERLEAENRLRRSESRFRVLVEEAPFAIAIARENRQIFCNKALVDMLGYDSPEDLIGFGSDIMVAASERENILDRIRRRSIGEKVENVYQSRLMRKDGSEVPIMMYVTQIQLEEGPATVTLGLDISDWKAAELELLAAHRELELRVEERTIELKQAMNQIVQTEKLASLGSLVAGIAHELSTPVGNTVTLATALGTQGIELRQLIGENKLTKSKLEDFFRDMDSSISLIETNLRKVAQLVQNFRQLASDQTSDRRRPFSLSDLLREVAEAERPAFNHSHIGLDLQYNPGLNMDSYPGPLRQVISELLENARTHAYPRGPGVVKLSASAQGKDRVAIVCADSGVGIAPELHKNIFDPFFTTRLAFGQSGLGLFHVFSLVTGTLGGTIHVHSLLGEGTRFEIELPVKAPAMIG